MNDDIKQVQDRLKKIEDDLIAERSTRTANRKWASGAGLVLITWLGYTSFYQIPKAVEQSSTGQVAREAQQARDRAVKDAERISESASKVNAAAERINAGHLKFEKKCVERDSNGCNPILPPCSPGFVEAFDVSNTWKGGPCGEGHVCRVCYQFENK